MPGERREKTKEQLPVSCQYHTNAFAVTMVRSRDDYDFVQMLIYKTRDSDLHTGHMVWCFKVSMGLPMNFLSDMSRSMGVDGKEFEGGFVLEPQSRCYKGQSSSRGTHCGLDVIEDLLGLEIGDCFDHEDLLKLEIGDCFDREDSILLMTETEYMCIVGKELTILCVMLNALAAATGC
ncbi:hypothetical protein FOPE_10724 [Fonsecaea pedrosoi]|nr:hypothetical protein FOPE_10724 [Fonsecaea pedrosoi]